MSSFRIGSHRIGGPRCFVVVEVGQAHDGSLGAAHAFIEFLLSEEGQKLVSTMGVYPITAKYKVQGPAGSNQEKAVAFTGGIRSFFDIPVGNVYNDTVAGGSDRDEKVNAYFRKEIAEKHKDLVKR